MLTFSFDWLRDHILWAMGYVLADGSLPPRTAVVTFDTLQRTHAYDVMHVDDYLREDKEIVRTDSILYGCLTFGISGKLEFW